jgi:hypothetical protein
MTAHSQASLASAPANPASSNPSTPSAPSHSADWHSALVLGKRQIGRLHRILVDPQGLSALAGQYTRIAAIPNPEDAQAEVLSTEALAIVPLKMEGSTLWEIHFWENPLNRDVINLVQVTQGQRLAIQSPQGQMTWNPEYTGKHAVLMAWGLGGSALWAILQEWLEMQPDLQSVELVWGVESPEDLCLELDLRSLEKSWREQSQIPLTRSYWIRSWDQELPSYAEAGFHSYGGSQSPDLQTWVRDPAQTIVFLCGPSPWCTEQILQAQALGLPMTQVRYQILRDLY